MPADHQAPSGIRILAQKLERMATGQAEALPVMITEVLAQAGVKPLDLDRIAVTNGPGSFTGVRIGVACARALKLAIGADVVTCSSLAVLACGVEAPGDGASLSVVTGLPEAVTAASPVGKAELLVAMDARRDQAYVQLFSLHTQTPRTEPQLMPYSDAARLGSEKTLVLVGTAAELVATQARQIGRSCIHIGKEVVPDAADLALMAARLEPLDTPLRPVYLRPPDARPSSVPTIQRTAT